MSAQDALFTFVTTGVEDATRRPRELVGDRHIAVTPGEVGGQVIAAGLADEVAIDQVPVAFGSGKRYFGSQVVSPYLLQDPHLVIAGDRVVHLRYRVGSGHARVT